MAFVLLSFKHSRSNKLVEISIKTRSILRGGHENISGNEDGDPRHSDPIRVIIIIHPAVFLK